MLVLAEKAAGESHIQRGLPCQDHLTYKVSGKALIFALADGAGSAKEPSLGASIASRAFVGIGESLLNEDPDKDSFPKLIRRVFQKTRKVISRVADKKGMFLTDMHTTLVGGWYHKECLVCSGVGDSLALVVARNGEILLPFPPAKGEYINETAFITMEGWERFLRVGKLIYRPKALLVFSDGLMNIVYGMKLQGGRWEVLPDEGFIRDLIQYLRDKKDPLALQMELKEMLSSPRAQRLNDDDKSLMVVLFDEREAGNT